ncbi:MAG: gluconate 2-dehydrogenase subunit 3 family protein [Pedobacter sp.]|nr:gluconate 2-dehydrogenase subunit 3 family protein [Pedobacter sp.]
MDRRDAVKSVAFLIGGALSATTIATLFDSCTQPGKNTANLFSADQEKLVAEIADIILPTTAKSPGAKAANVGPFITMMMKDCYPEEAQKAFVKGLEDLEAQAKKEYNKTFMAISVPERISLITKLKDETIAAQKAEKEAQEKAEKPAEVKTSPVKEAPIRGANKSKPMFYAIARDLTILGFFSSEIGVTKANEFVEYPGRYDGCVDLKPGQKVWA